MSSVLQVGAVIASHTPDAWVCDLLSKLDLHPRIDLRTAVVAPNDKPPETLQTYKGLRSIGHWILHRKIDKPRFAHNPWQSAALAEGINITDDSEASNSLSQCRVVLNLCNADLPSALLDNSSVSVWHAHLKSLDARIEEALLKQEPMTWVHLWSQEIVNGRESEPVTLIASHALPRQTYSLTDLRRAAYCSLPSVFSSRLNWLAHESKQLDVELDNPATSCNDIRVERFRYNQRAQSLADSNFALPLFTDTSYLLRTIKLWYRQMQQRISDRIWIEQWQLGVFHHDQNSSTLISDIAATKLDDYRAIPSPSTVLRADPHACELDGDIHVFYEEMPVTGSKAYICCAKLDASGNASEFGRVMEEEQHLSYPFVFSHDGITYMIPETASRNKVSLYQAREYPWQWDRVSDLLTDINTADTTVIFHENRWWLFTNTQSHKVVDERDELLVYHADDILGPWQAHPLNPVLTGIDRARMAGPIIAENGVLHRPSQYGAIRYGHGINLNRIDRLDTTHYQETPVGRILPDSGTSWEGCHSITRVQDLTILDRVHRQRR